MDITFPIAFDKLNGSGNDFIIIDNRKGIIPLACQSEFSRLICRRMFSVGADGVILIEDCKEADFRWQFYNADGSKAEMCGNGSRCAARFAWRHKIAGRKMTFSTLAGIVEAEIGEDDSIVKVHLPDPTDFRLHLSVELDDQEFPLFFVNSGVPHAVIFVDYEKEIPVNVWGRKVRYETLFAPDGTNVNFVQVKDTHTIKVRTYERGVEGETMACGTGNIAASIYSALEKGLQSPITIETYGGEKNRVYFELQDGPTAKNVFLEGPTMLVCSGELTPDAILQQGRRSS